MPDLVPQSFYHCETAEYWETEAVGSNDVYIVKFDRFGHSNRHYQCDYSCTCQAYKYGNGKYCKHILSVKDHHCNWTQFIDGGEPEIINNEKRCPKCKRPVHAGYWGI